MTMTMTAPHNFLTRLFLSLIFITYPTSSDSSHAIDSHKAPNPSTPPHKTLEWQEKDAALHTFLSHSVPAVLEHTGSEAFDEHLKGVQGILRWWDAEEHVCSAGLFHSIYGTEGFQGFSLPLAQRAVIRDLIGFKAERLCWIFCMVDRSTVDETVFKKWNQGDSTRQSIYTFYSRPELGRFEIILDHDEWVDFVELSLADWLEQVQGAAESSSSLFLWNMGEAYAYRRTAYVKMAEILKDERQLRLEDKVNKAMADVYATEASTTRHLVQRRTPPMSDAARHALDALRSAGEDIPLDFAPQPLRDEFLVVAFPGTSPCYHELKIEANKMKNNHDVIISPEGPDGFLASPEMNVAKKKKDNPTINDYYKAQAVKDKPIQYQHGLGNYSHVQFGDDRVCFKKSMSQVMYQLNEEMADTLTINDNPRKKSMKQRMLDYDEANAVVGHHKIREMEQMMRDKLQQRTKTGPFQLRKTFKYFDRDGSGGIDFDEFQRAMELMGFQFSDMQRLALFARYDESCSGEVDYSEFVEKVMESDFKGVSNASQKALNTLVSSAFLGDNGTGQALEGDEDSDLDDDELEQFRKTEVKKLFKIVDSDGSDLIEKSEIAELLQKLGKTLSAEEIDAGFENIDIDSSGKIDFDEFYTWYNTVVNGIRKK